MKLACYSYIWVYLALLSTLYALPTRIWDRRKNEELVIVRRTFSHIKSALQCANECIRTLIQCKAFSVSGAPETKDFQCSISDKNITASSPGISSYMLREEPQKLDCSQNNPNTYWNTSIKNVQPSSVFIAGILCTKNVQSLALSPTHIYLPCWWAKKAVIIDINSGLSVTQHPTGHWVWDAVYVPVLGAVIMSRQNTSELIHVTLSGVQVYRDVTVDGNTYPRGLAVHGADLVYGDEHKKSVIFLNPVTQTVTYRMTTELKPYYICSCPSGQFAITYQKDHNVTMYNVSKQKLWSAAVTNPRGCHCDDCNNLLVTSRTEAEIYRVSAEGGDVTVYHRLADMLPYFSSHGLVNKVAVQNNILYYVTDTGRLYLHNL